MSRSVWLCIATYQIPPPDTEDSDMVAVGIRGHGKAADSRKTIYFFSFFFYYFFSFWLRITLGLYHHTISRFFSFLLHCLVLLGIAQQGRIPLPSFSFRLQGGAKEGGRKPPVGRGTRSSWKEKEKEDHRPQGRSSTWIFLIVIAGAFWSLHFFFFLAL